VDKLLALNEGRVTAYGPKNEVLAHLSSGEQRAEPAVPKPAKAQPTTAIRRKPPHV
jgi:ABC-type protease/lipase transport system fused ATPase/permease subunit